MEPAQDAVPLGLAAADPVLSSWSGRLADWMKVRGLLEKENEDRP